MESAAHNLLEFKPPDTPLMPNMRPVIERELALPSYLKAQIQP